MRRIAVIAAVLLAGSTWGCQGRIGTPGEVATVEGCLSNSGGHYTLTSDSGHVYQLSGSTGKLSSHVGEQVVIRGEQVESKRAPEAPAESNGNRLANRINVNSATFTSKKCGGSK